MMQVNLYEKTLFLTLNLEKELKISFSFSQRREIERLIYEILLLYPQLKDKINPGPVNKNLKAKNLFLKIKKHLIQIRYPDFISETDRCFLPPISNAKENKIYHPGNKQFTPSKIFIEENASDSHLAQRCISFFPKAEHIVIPSVKQAFKEKSFDRKADLKTPFLFIVKEHHDFIKPCPCTPGHLGCGYWILNIGFGCPFDCAYCYLQQYQNIPGIVLPANLDLFKSEFDQFIKTIKKPIRIGTGEFTDSLALDNITEYSKELIPFFSKYNAIFELKTKSNCIENVLKQEPKENIVISWSLNPEDIIDKHELGTATLKQRVQAAKQCSEHGFKIGFHFDPIIYYDNWQKEYKQVINMLQNQIKDTDIAWISLGTLRFQRDLKRIAEQRFDLPLIYYGPLFKDNDKKLRYPRELRKNMYSFIIKLLREKYTNTPVYLCMESKDIWDSTIKHNSSIENYILKS